MLGLSLARDPRTRLTLLCLGAHCDDIEIGCGASLQKLIAERQNLEVFWVVLSSDPAREREARRSAAFYLSAQVTSRIEVESFRNGYFPYVGADLKDYFEDLKRHVDPDLIFTHYREDLHQDHRLVAELTWNTFRDHLILEYEVPKYDGGLGSPNLFIPTARSFCEQKVDALVRFYKSQAARPWFTQETFMALMRLRGIECNAPSGYAEAFYCRKLTF